MKIDKIITLASADVQWQFMAMERSLRACGCDLPLLVIPYDDQRTFDLPSNASWWRMDEVVNWLQQYNAFPALRKYQCLLTDNYQYVDSDIVFLRNPQEVLVGQKGFITSCGHWHNTGHTCTSESLTYLKDKSTTWPKLVFNSGQFACDQQLYTFDTLKKTCEGSFKKTLLTETNLYKDQPAINLLVNMANVSIQNLTLPPYNMQSTWAGDYTGEYERYWEDEMQKPYLIHWAGCSMNDDKPINQLFTRFLNEEEKENWKKQAKKGGIAGQNLFSVGRLKQQLKHLFRS